MSMRKNKNVKSFESGISLLQYMFFIGVFGIIIEIVALKIR